MLDSTDLRTRVLARLDEIKDPCSVAAGAPMGLAEMGLIGELKISTGGDVAIEMRLTSPFCHMIGFFEVEARRLLLEIPGITRVSLTGDTGLDWSPQDIDRRAQSRRNIHLQRMQ